MLNDGAPNPPKFVFRNLPDNQCRALANENKHATLQCFDGSIFCTSCGLELKAAHTYPAQQFGGGPPPPPHVIRTGC